MIIEKRCFENVIASNLCLKAANEMREAIKPLYGFQCQECFIQSGQVSRDLNDAPGCCGDEKMVAYRSFNEVKVF